MIPPQFATLQSNQCSQLFQPFHTLKPLGNNWNSCIFKLSTKILAVLDEAFRLGSLSLTFSRVGNTASLSTTFATTTTTVLSCCKTSETVFMRNSILGSLGGRSSEPRGNEADVPYIPLRSKIFELLLRDSVTKRDPRWALLQLVNYYYYINTGEVRENTTWKIQ